jgi:hypothetical protein
MTEKCVRSKNQVIFDTYRIVYINGTSTAHFPTNYPFYLPLKMDLPDILDNTVPETVFHAIEEDVELVDLSASSPTSPSLTPLPTPTPPPLTPPTQIFDIEREIDLNLAVRPCSGYWSVLTPLHGLPIIEEDEDIESNGGKGPSSQEPPSKTLTLPFGEISSDSEDEIEEIPRPFTPHEPPEEIALAARLRQVVQDLESLDNSLPHTRAPGSRLQGI